MRSKPQKGLFSQRSVVAARAALVVIPAFWLLKELSDMKNQYMEFMYSFNNRLITLEESLQAARARNDSKHQQYIAAYKHLLHKMDPTAMTAKFEESDD
jgi:hypothetical protein